ncbi:CDP-glycerol glycerophosphotransferase family protein [Nocardioides terrisoli]|uniref:CDP-glycerol glycerophosphotransferase family protein n=1 Tax=Nocardioides terrisoli TaxID=3388267 RepID=UPI00287BBF48|nr:CDP-glycerol glycerophosphotransferase family protein [Nocardioides marmorisolisilvae]
MTHVVTVGPGQEPFLDDALVSVRRQTYPASRVSVARWGEGTDVPDLATARNDALRQAGGRYARLLEASDTLPWHSTALLVRALRGTGWASAAGRSVRGSGWRDAAFSRAAGVEPGAGDRLLDLSRWRASGVGFDPGHGRFGDAALAALDAAGGCGLIDAVTHEDRDRALGLPFGHLRRWSLEADAWLAAVESAATRASSGWTAAVLDHRLPALLQDVERLDDDQWTQLQQLAATLLARLGEEAAEPEELVRAESRIFAWLVAVGARDRVTALVLRRWRAPDDIATDVRDGQVLADLGVEGVPDAARRLGRAETPLALLPVRRTPDRLELVGFIRGVSTDEPPRVRASYAGREVPVASTSTPTATKIAAEAEHDHDHAWLSLDLTGLPATGELTVELTVRGVTRSGTVADPATLEPAVRDDPRGDDEIGPRAQLLLQRWYADERAPGPIEPDLAYFQAYAGQRPTDSPLAIHDALRRTHPEIRTRWLVERLDVPLPEGAEPVLLRSREWYRTLATARWLVTNIEMERWFRRRPGQDLLQTFHGNPGKTMGFSAWRAAGLTQGRIEQTLDHGARNWTLLASPSPEMTVHYREQFDYRGAVVDHGYPRDDVLVGPRAAEIRERTRAALGVGPDQVAVLYAPTWRDELAVNYRRARLHRGFDVAEAATALGAGHVLMQRGHRFHRDVSGDVTTAVNRDPAAGRVLDVTAYPEVNDLLLAADVAVLDYSSLRFDFALTGRPMVFCVPDLADYADRRGFLYDYRESAPGPLLATTDEVVTALGDLPGLERAYADERAAFHERFNRFQDGHAAERAVAAFFGPSPTGGTPAAV